MITIRPLEAADKAWLVPAFEAYLTGIAPDTAIDPIDQWWAEALQETFVITNPEVVGFAMIWRHDDATWTLSEFCILPDLRRQGVGRAAVEALLRARPGRWQLGVVARGPARAFWSHVLPGLPGLTELSQHPPLSETQALSYRFRMAEEAHD